MDPSEKVGPLMRYLYLRAEQASGSIKCQTGFLVNLIKPALQKNKESEGKVYILCRKTVIAFDKGLILLWIKAHCCVPGL